MKLEQPQKEYTDLIVDPHGRSPCSTAVSVPPVPEQDADDESDKHQHLVTRRRAINGLRAQAAHSAASTPSAGRFGTLKHADWPNLLLLHNTFQCWP